MTAERTGQSRHSGSVGKSADAFRTIGEVAAELDVPRHVLRFWESKFSQIRPMKRGGGRRYYRPEDIHLIRVVRTLLYDQGYTIKGAQRFLKEAGPRAFLPTSPSSASQTDDSDAGGTADSLIGDQAGSSQPVFSSRPHLQPSDAAGDRVLQGELRSLLDELVAIRCLLDDQES